MRSPIGGRRALEVRQSTGTLLSIVFIVLVAPFGAQLAAAASTDAVKVRVVAGPSGHAGPLRPALVKPPRISAHTVHRGVWVGGRATVLGRFHPAQPGMRIEIQRRTRGKWWTADTVRSGRHGRFRASFKLPNAGLYSIRVKFTGNQIAAATTKRIGRVGSFRPGGASYYGPGGRTACGQTLTAATQGVAHKTLPCGTKVTLYYRGRIVRVPVIDRGPFVPGRDWDLTIATKNRLGFGSTGVVGSAW